MPQNEANTGSTTPLFVLAAIALLSAVWSAFQWSELLTLREGGEIFCAAGSAEGCAALADSDFAVWVQRVSGLPIAGWGLVWSGAALAVAIGALLRRQADGSSEPFGSAALVVSAAGVASVLVLAAVSGMEGAVCANCVITYALTLAYAGTSFATLRGPALQLPLGIGVSALVTVIGFLALLYPGLNTPFPRDEAAHAAVSRALEPPAPGSDAEGMKVTGTLPSPQTLALLQLVDALDPEMQQALSNTLAEYDREQVATPSPPRAVTGDANAPVRITDFTDTLCGHCANLHHTLELMLQQLPPGSFSIDSRHFPLDGNCNPNVSRKQEDPVRCVAASAQICLEEDPRAFEFAGLLYRNQRTLDVDMVYELAAPYMEKDALQACVESDATREKLLADIARALEFGIRGTPLVLINDRKASAYGPFLYAMVVTGGATDDPAFGRLPPEKPHDHEHDH